MNTISKIKLTASAATRLQGAAYRALIKIAVELGFECQEKGLGWTKLYGPDGTWFEGSVKEIETGCEGSISRYAQMVLDLDGALTVIVARVSDHDLPGHHAAAHEDERRFRLDGSAGHQVRDFAGWAAKIARNAMTEAQPVA